jgi:hypothetical protein
VGAAGIPLRLSNMAGVIRTPTPCPLSLCLPLIPAAVFFSILAASNYTVGEVIYKATPASCERAARNRIRYIPPTTMATTTTTTTTTTMMMMMEAAAAAAAACAQIRDRR